MHPYEEEITIKGKPIRVPSIRSDNRTLIVMGKFIKTASMKDEWFEHIDNPQKLITHIREARPKVDIFTFWQTPPHTEPKHDFYTEWDPVSILPIKSFEHWWKNQISSQTRNKARKAQKKGVVIKVADFNDDLVKGIMHIFDETPIRRGKPFWHYGKDFDTVKREWARDLQRCDFIGAYYHDELIGFIKLVYADYFAQQVQNISMLKHRNKYPTNALIAKAVEVCDKKAIPYLTYGGWRKGSHAAFLRRNGFEKILLPRYFIPLSIKGQIALKLKLHRSISAILPENLKAYLLNLRGKWYTRKYAQT